MTIRSWLNEHGAGVAVRVARGLRVPLLVAALTTAIAHEAAVYGGSTPAPAPAPDGGSLLEPVAEALRGALPLDDAASGALHAAWVPVDEAAVGDASADAAGVRARAAVDVARGIIDARARGVQVVSLGQARALAAAGDWEAVRPKAELLWVYGVDKPMQDAGLQLLVQAAAAKWPNDHRGRFLRRVLPMAMRSGRDRQVPPSVTVGQAIVESGWGRSGLARRHNNLFGVKGGAVRMKTAEFRGGRWRRTSASYRSYATLDDSLAHHADIMNGPHFRRYRSLWTDWQAYLNAIAPKYASSPTYVRNVSSMVERYGLAHFDALTVEGWQRDQARGG